MSSIPHYKYLVVEDESLIRKNLIKKITALELPLTLIGEAANGMEAIVKVEKDCPDLVITDIRMPQCDGLELSRYLHKNHPGVKIIILSGYDDFSYAQAAIKFAVRDYLLKPVTQHRGGRPGGCAAADHDGDGDRGTGDLPDQEQRPGSEVHLRAFGKISSGKLSARRLLSGAGREIRIYAGVFGENIQEIYGGNSVQILDEAENERSQAAAP